MHVEQLCEQLYETMQGIRKIYHTDGKPRQYDVRNQDIRRLMGRP